MLAFGVASNGHGLSWELYKSDEAQLNHVQAVWMFFMVMLFLFILFTGILGGYHAYLILSGQTTWEHSSRMNITYLRPYKTGILPFYLGFKEHIR